MSSLKNESIAVLLDVEEALTGLLRATSPDDRQRVTRLAYLIERARTLRQAWDTRWVRLDGVQLAHEAEERKPRRPRTQRKC